MLSWCTIESDPGVFTELIQKIGVEGVQVEELYEMDQKSLDALRPVYGLIFLFKWDKKLETKDSRPVLDQSEAPGVFFAKQEIPNACATQAIISILLNRNEISLGKELSDYKMFALSLPPDMRGYLIGNSPTIQKAHNSFRRPEPFVFSEKTAKEDDDVYHFVGYVPVDGNLYELDGLKPGPILLGDCTLENWLEKVRPAIQSRIKQYSEKEVRFNLLAIVKDRTLVYKEELKKLESKKQKIEAKITKMEDQGKDVMDTTEDDGLPNAVTELKSLLQSTDIETKDVQENIKREQDKHQKWKVENVRRKHNYVPFVFNLLKILAEKGKLPELVEKSQKLTASRAAAREASKKKDKEKEKPKETTTKK